METFDGAQGSGVDAGWSTATGTRCGRVVSQADGSGGAVLLATRKCVPVSVPIPAPARRSTFGDAS